MAILKSKTMASGAVGEYWKIVSVSVDRLQMRATWRIELFLDQAKADSGAPGMGCTKQFSAVCTQEELAADLAAIGYAKIKTQAAALVRLRGLGGSIPVEPQPFDADLVGGIDV